MAGITTLLIGATPGPTPKGARLGQSLGSWKARVIVIIGIVILASFVGYLSYGFYLSHLRPVWLFKGAYAEYSGNTTLRSFSSQITLRIEVIDYNSSAVELQYSGRLNSSLFNLGNTATRWVTIEKASMVFPFFSPLSPAEVTDGTVFIGGKKIGVTEYQYMTENSTLTVYVDKGTNFPVEFGLVTSSGLLMEEIKIAQTNIGGLP